MEKRGLNYIHGICATVVAILFLLFGGFIMIPIFGEKGSLYACIPIALIGIGFTYFTKTKPKEVFPFALPPIKTFFGAILLAIGVRMFSTAISVAVSLIFDSNVRSDEINSILSKMSPFTAIIVVAVLPAICEEFFCRGFLVRCFSKIKSEKLIVCITAIIFGVMHLDPYSFFYTAIFGGLLCYIALKTKSLLIPIFLHFTSNALSVFMMFYMANVEQDVSAATTLSIGQNLSLILYYLGICAIPTFIGYRLFNGKKIRGKALGVVILSAIIVVISANYILTKTSYVQVDSGEESIEYQGVISENFALEINEKGAYVFSGTFTCEDNIDIIIMCDDEEIYKTSDCGLVFVNFAFECKDENSEYFVIIKNSLENEALWGKLDYGYKLEKVNL